MEDGSGIPKLKEAVMDSLDSIKLQPTKGMDYENLRNLLRSGQWQEADQETEKVMLEVARQTKQGFLMPDDLTNFPCEDLLTIDRLWVEASNGHFGFSVQKKIWEECGSPMESNDDCEKFMERVGWYLGSYFVSHSDFKFSPLHSPIGELPSAVLTGISFRLFSSPLSLFSRKDL